MKHVHLISGGGGSWLAAKVHMERHPGDEHLFSFTDVLYEDADCYRFLLEGVCHLLGIAASWVPRAVDFPDYRVPLTTPIEEYAGNPEWRAFLAALRAEAQSRLPQLSWLVEGRDVWEVFRDVRFLGNSSVDPCSRVLKRDIRDRWLAATFPDKDVVLTVGIGPDERHRFEGGRGSAGFGPRMAAAGWRAEAPLLAGIEGEIGAFVYMEKAGIERPRLYRAGSMHNNCGGFCCKAGHAHYQNRWFRMPERYEYDAAMEQKIRDYLKADVSMLTDRAGGKGKQALTLAEFARRLRAKPGLRFQYMTGESGCGCAIDE